jgi:hypothetical protein
MAITSIGYDGSVSETQWAKLIPKAGASHYGVDDSADWKVSAHATLDRGVSIAVGTGWGQGVLDTSDTTVSLQAATLSSGTRWDLVVARRNWSGTGGTTTFAIKTGSASKTIPSRNHDPGSLDDQPLALIQITAGSSGVTSIIDLRCWARNGGVVAKDELALTYLKEPGAQVKINGVLWSCYINSSGSSVWSKQAADGYIPLLGTSGSLVNTGPNTGSFYVQAGSHVGKTDGAGYGRITFPKPFPTGLVTVILTNGDSSIDRARSMTLSPAVSGSPWNNGTKVDVVYTLMNSAGGMTPNQLARINWIAIGW